MTQDEYENHLKNGKFIEKSNFLKEIFENFYKESLIDTRLLNNHNNNIN